MDLKIAVESNVNKAGVKSIQMRLNKNGGKLTTDGIYGKKTLAAIKKFQKSHGLKGSGKIGPRTLELLGLDTYTGISNVKGYKTPLLPDKVVKKPKKIESAKILKMYPNKKLLIVASKELGVKEIRGSRSNPRVVLYHAYATVNNVKGSPDSVPWCSSAVCFVTEMAGLTSTNSKMARSWERHKLIDVSKDPLPGDIVTMFRNGRRSGSGHVGFVVKVTSKYIYVMGGNQSDGFNIKKFARKSSSSSKGITGFWRYSHKDMPQAMRAELIRMGNVLVAGKTIDSAGSVV